MHEESKILEAMKKHSCTREQAIAILSKHKLVQATESFTGSKSNCVLLSHDIVPITYYSNGILIQSNFFLYSKEGTELKSQILSGELDYNLAKLNPGTEVQVEIIDKSNEYYGKKDLFTNLRKLNESELIQIKPINIQVDEPDLVTVKLFVNGKSAIVKAGRMNKVFFLRKVVEGYEGYRKERFVLRYNNEDVDEEEYLGKYDGCVIKAVFKT